MPAQLPEWVLYLQALSTPAIAVLAAVIGFMQWRTAHQRAVLDLFEKRYELYTAVRSVIAEVIAHGRADNKIQFDYLRAIERAPFLFGPEVTAYLDSLYRLLVAQGHAETMMKTESAEEHAKWISKQHECFLKVAEFYQRSEPLVQPYMRMHQKAPWSLRAIWAAAGFRKRSPNSGNQ
jgi:hypothetical protein